MKRPPSVQHSPRPALPKRGPYLLPLDLLLAVGTVLIPRQRQICRGEGDGDDQVAEDGWRVLGAGSLEEVPEEIIESTETPGSSTDLPSPSAFSTPIPPASPQRPHSPSKKNTPKRQKVARTPTQVLGDLLALQNALLLRATYRLDEQSGTAVIRIYLVPVDLAELRLPEVAETRKKSPATSVMVGVLAGIRCRKDEWEGKAQVDVEQLEHRLMDDKDQRSILEIYRQTPSPPDDPAFYCNLDAPDSTTHGASVAKMLAREMAPQLSLDPSYLERQTFLSRDRFFVNVDGIVSRAPVKIREPKGGFLSENMGAGKTAISLALILSTLHTLPILEGVSTHLDGSPSASSPLLLTHLSTEFPSTQYRDERRRLRPRLPPPLPGVELDAIDQQAYVDALAYQAWLDTQEARPSIPSLSDIAINVFRTSSGHSLANHGRLALKDEEGLTTYERLERIMSGEPRLSMLDQLRNATPFYYLHPSIAQLNTREGRRGAYSARKIYVTSATLVVVPTDLVLQWKDEIAKHVSEEAGLRVLVLKTSKDAFPSAVQFTEYDLVLMSMSRFSDAADDLETSLLSVHWKRIFCDEGHVLGSANRMRKLAQELRCECAWVISGTPTKNLRGDDDGTISQSTAAGDEADFKRLGEIFSRYLKHPAFPKPEVWNRTITIPALEQKRGISRLAHVLDQALVRNQQNIIDHEYFLPPLTSTVEYLDLVGEERKTYNALFAIFTLNSVQSQRADKDYFFHQDNKKYLDELTLNLSASSFFFASTGYTSFLIEAVKHAKEMIDRPDKWTALEMEQQLEAVRLIEEALDDAEWQQVVGTISVGIEVRGLDQHLDLIKLFDGLALHKNPRQRSLLPLGKLTTLRRDVLAVRTTDSPSWVDDDDFKEELVTFESNRLRDERASKSSKALASALSAAPKVPKKRKAEATSTVQPLPPSSLFFNIALGRTSSTKLNFCIDQVRAHPDDKFIIFCSSLPDLIFANLSEAFDLLRIRHLIYASHSHKRDRGAIAIQFNATTVKQCQVILVDARLGGRGVNLTAASRVILLEPIWSPDLELQAIKRAHRLGQQKPVSVQTLVVRNSFEHELLKRRNTLTQADINKTKQPQRDTKLRDLLQSATYLPKSHIEEKEDEAMLEGVIWTPLLLEEVGENAAAGGQSAKRAEARAAEGSHQDAGSVPRVDEAPPVQKKAKKLVKFAE